MIPGHSGLEEDVASVEGVGSTAANQSAAACLKPSELQWRNGEILLKSDRLVDASRHSLAWAARCRDAANVVGDRKAVA